MLMFAILLYAQSQSLGEKVFIGALSGLILSFIIWLIQRKDKKKAEKEYEIQKQEHTRQIQRDIASNQQSLNISISDIDYSNLYDELKEKCNPSNFMQPYNAEQVEISNSIYSQLDANKKDLDALIRLRNLAISKLGISFSPKALFERLCDIYNPSKFMGENYNAEKLSAANKIYEQVLQKKDNIIELERIAKENGVSLFKGSEDHLAVESMSVPTSTHDAGESSNKYLFRFIGVFISVIVLFAGISFHFLVDKKLTPSVTNASNVVSSYLDGIRRNSTGESDMIYSECVSFNQPVKFSCTFDLESKQVDIAKHPAIVVFHNKDAVVNLNGEEHIFNIKEFNGYNIVSDDGGWIVAHIISDGGNELLYTRYYSYFSNESSEILVCVIDGKDSSFTTR